MAKDNDYYNHEGYHDPTAGKAIKNLTRKKRDAQPAPRPRKRRKKYNGA